MLNLTIIVAQFVAGIWSGSLALLSDAAHNVTDGAALALAWYAAHQAQRPADREMTYGYHRAGILAALANGVALVVIAAWVIWEAWERFANPPQVEMTALFIGGAVGLVANLLIAFKLRGSDDLNVRGAVLHMVGDAAGSAGVILGGVVMLYTGAYWIDPALSVLICLLIAWTARDVIRQSVRILMEGVPRGVDPTAVRTAIGEVPGVRGVHDLHIWSLTAGKNACSCHVAVDGTLTVSGTADLRQEILHRLEHMGISHATVQFEEPGADCNRCET